MKSLTVLLAALVSLSSIGNVEAKDNKYMKAVCKVVTGPGSGTGFVIHEDDHHFYVLTAAHVIINDPKATMGMKNSIHRDLGVHFFRNNKISVKYKADLVWWHFDWPNLDDMAILAVDKTLVKEEDLPTPWLLHSGPLEIKKGVVRSIGLPWGRWPMGWTGELVDVIPDENDIVINFGAIPGQSGSPLIQNSQIVGIILTTHGNGCDVNKIRSLIKSSNKPLFKYLYEGKKSNLSTLVSGTVKFLEPHDAS